MRINIIVLAMEALALATALDRVVAADINGIVHTSPRGPLPFQGSTSDNRNRVSTLSIPIRISLSDLNSRLGAFVPNRITWFWPALVLSPSGLQDGKIFR
jgi:hypothetical protein